MYVIFIKDGYAEYNSKIQKKLDTIQDGLNMVCVKCGHLKKLIKIYKNKKALFTKGFSFRYQVNYNYEKKVG